MNSHSQILAKSDGSTTLAEHISYVSAAIDKMAHEWNFDPNIARKGAVLHDIGKVHPEFQKKLINNKFGKLDALCEIPLRHEISSLLFLPLFETNEWPALIDMIIGHHRSIKSMDSLYIGNGILDLIEHYDQEELFLRHTEGWVEWMPVAIEILALFNMPVRSISLSEAKHAFDYLISYCEQKEFAWSKWKGLLTSADHFASALADRTIPALDKMFCKPVLSANNYKDVKTPLYPLTYYSTSDPRPHTIVIACTGSGKTDFLLKRCRKRIFYLLPFQASINAMYERVKNMYPGYDVRMLHASSKISLRNIDGKSFEEEKVMQSLTGAAVKVLTPHQIAAIIFGTKGFESISLDLAGNDVILDEIHSYSKTSMTMVSEIINALIHLGCRIHIGTATMPSMLLKQVYEILGGDEKVYKVTLGKNELRSFNRHIVHKHDNEEFMKDVIDNAIKDKEKMLIIKNQVKKAQYIFKKISAEYPQIPVMLIHSQYKRLDRAILEREVKDEFNNKMGPCIVVSTQVVEVSLDINFDVLISDCAPIDSLVQRFGRINRKRDYKTIGHYKDVHVIAPPKDINEALPYDYNILTETFKCLPNNKLLEEDQIQDLIDTVYPNIEVSSIKSHLVRNDGQFNLLELCYYSRSVLLEALEIESASCIIESDKEAYTKAPYEEKAFYEIPISWRSACKRFNNYYRLNVGQNPFVIPDELYSSIMGLALNS